MQISNIQNLSFSSQDQIHRRPRKRTRDNLYSRNETLNQDSFKKAPKKLTQKQKAIISTLAAIDLFGLGVLSGHIIGYNQARNKYSQEPIIQQQLYPPSFYLQETATPEEAIIENEDVFVIPTNSPIRIVEAKPTAAPIEGIPQSVCNLADGERIKEIDLTKEPFVNTGTMPTYLENAEINGEVLASAQANVARIFEAGDYIIICPNADTTMGTLKAVFGIIDGAADIEGNNLKTRQLISGSKGNLDDAIIPAGDAIKIERYNKERGHQIGAFLFHQSNRSRNKIIRIIKENTNLY